MTRWRVAEQGIGDENRIATIGRTHRAAENSVYVSVRVAAGKCRH
jgi:hypothetical protein